MKTVKPAGGVVSDGGAMVDEATIARAIFGLPYMDPADLLRLAAPRSPAPICAGCRGQGCVHCGRPARGFLWSLRDAEDAMGLLIEIEHKAKRMRMEYGRSELDLVRDELQSAYEALEEAEIDVEAGDEDAFVEDMRDLHRRRGRA